MIATNDQPTPATHGVHAWPILRHCKGGSSLSDILVRTQNTNITHTPPPLLPAARATPRYRTAISCPQIPLFNLYATEDGERPQSVSTRAREAALRRPWKGREGKVVAAYTLYQRAPPEAGGCVEQSRRDADGNVTDNVRPSPSQFPFVSGRSATTNALRSRYHRLVAAERGARAVGAADIRPATAHQHDEQAADNGAFFRPLTRSAPRHISTH